MADMTEILVKLETVDMKVDQAVGFSYENSKQLTKQDRQISRLQACWEVLPEKFVTNKKFWMAVGGLAFGLAMLGGPKLITLIFGV